MVYTVPLALATAYSVLIVALGRHCIDIKLRTNCLQNMSARCLRPVASVDVLSAHESDTFESDSCCSTIPLSKD